MDYFLGFKAFLVFVSNFFSFNPPPPSVPSSAFPNDHFACADSLLFLRSFDSQFVGLCLRFGCFNSNRMDFIEANSAKGISRRDLAMKANEMEKLGRNGESLF